MYQLRALGVSAKDTRMYKCLVLPRWEYAMHLNPWALELSPQIEEVEKAFSGK